MSLSFILRKKIPTFYFMSSQMTFDDDDDDDLIFIHWYIIIKKKQSKKERFLDFSCCGVKHKKKINRNFFENYINIIESYQYLILRRRMS